MVTHQLTHERMIPAKIGKRRVPAKSPNATPSPPAKQKKENEMEELMKEVRLMMKKVDDDKIERLKEAKEERLERQEERKEEMERLEGLLTAHRDSWEKEKIILMERQEKLEERLCRLEKAEKRNNVIVSNYSAKETDSRKLAREMEGMMSRKAGEPVRVETAYSIRSVLGVRQVVRLAEFEDKMIVMRNKKKFFEEKGDKRIPIYVDDDLTPEEREIQKKARDFAKMKREEGCEVKVGHKKVFVKGVEMRWVNEEKGFVEFGKKN